jgi:hypothetical protein
MRIIIPIFVVTVLAGCCGKSTPFRGIPAKHVTVRSESICDCLSPYNDPQIMTEWMKIQNRLQSNGITLGVASSIGATIFTSSDRAKQARSIIAEMIRNHSVDADKLKLKLRFPLCECVDPFTHEEVAKEWAKVEAKLEAKGIRIDSSQNGRNEVTAVFCVSEDQIESARSLISAMIRNGEIDAHKMGLRLSETE